MIMTPCNRLQFVLHACSNIEQQKFNFWKDLKIIVPKGKDVRRGLSFSVVYWLLYFPLDPKLQGNTTSFGGEVKPSAPCHKILRHVKNPCRDDSDTSPAKLTDLSLYVFPCFTTRCVCWYFPENSGK
jgi:hypothetical protein